MRRILRWSLVAGVLAFVPVSAEAALITQCADGTSPCEVIGTFSWDAPISHDGPEEPLAIPDFFALVNAFSEDFTNVILTLNGTEIYSLGEAVAGGGQADSLGLILPDAITSSTITFNVLGTQFFAEFPTAPALGESTATDIYAVVPVPEPASLALLSIGLGALAARRRRLPRFRTA